MGSAKKMKDIYLKLWLKNKQKNMPVSLFLAKINICEKFNEVIEPYEFLMPCEVPDRFFKRVKKLELN